MKTAPHDPDDPRALRTVADYTPGPDPVPWWRTADAVRALLVVLIAVSVIVTVVVFR